MWLLQLPGQRKRAERFQEFPELLQWQVRPPKSEKVEVRRISCLFICHVSAILVNHRHCWSQPSINAASLSLVFLDIFPVTFRWTLAFFKISQGVEADVYRCGKKRGENGGVWGLMVWIGSLRLFSQRMLGSIGSGCHGEFQRFVDPFFQASPSESPSLALLVVGVLGFRKSWEVQKMRPCWKDVGEYDEDVHCAFK